MAASCKSRKKNWKWKLILYKDVEEAMERGSSVVGLCVGCRWDCMYFCMSDCMWDCCLCEYSWSYGGEKEVKEVLQWVALGYLLGARGPLALWGEGIRLNGELFSQTLLWSCLSIEAWKLLTSTTFVCSITSQVCPPSAWPNMS